MKYNLELTEAQTEVVRDALDLYLRIRLGQIEEVLEPWLFTIRANGTEMTPEEADASRMLLELTKKALTGFVRQESFSISNPLVPDQARVASDLRQVIVQRLTWDRNPQGGGGLNHLKPANLGREPLATISKVEEAK